MPVSLLLIVSFLLLIQLLISLFYGSPTDNDVPDITVVPAVASMSVVAGITAVAASAPVAGVTVFDDVPAVEYTYCI